MSELQAVSGILAGLFSFVGYIPLILSILSRKTRPNRATWIIWGVVNSMIAASYYAVGARETLWVPLCFGICSSTVAILSIKYGEGGWTKFDRCCLISATISGIVWWYFNSPAIALLTNIAIDFIGSLPTIRKVYYEPETEERTPWVLFFVGSLANIVAIPTWQFSIVLYPAMQVIILGVILALVNKRKPLPKNNHAPRPGV